MRITIFAAGSRGDIQPCIVLGLSLQQAGFQVLMAAPQNFADFIQSHSLPFYPLHGDVQQIMSSDTGREFMESGDANPINSILAMRKMIGPIAMQMAEDLLDACHDADALISLAVFATLGKTIAQIQDIPWLCVEPTPMLPTGDFPAPGFPIQKNLGGLINRFSGFAMLWVIWQWYRPFVNEFRRRFELQPLGGGDFYRALNSVPLLGAYSSKVIPHPRDWSDSVHITGYWFQENANEWQPPIELATFLENGKPPVYIGFGSMTGRDPEHYAGIVLEALAKSGQRGVIATGWGGMSVMKIPDNVIVIDSAPHGWLFPRMSVVVHHGGAGTTAEGLRAGVPSVIVPFIVDQLFWGKRVESLGAGPKPIPAKNLTAEKLAEAIQVATTDSSIKKNAASLGKAVRAEHGVQEAVKIIKQYFGA